MVVDSASNVDDARALLPTDGINAAIVTSRDTLGLLAARMLDLDVLPSADAVAMLDRALRVARPDDSRITDHADDAATIAQLCGGLPLALEIIAALLAEDPGRPLSALADDLRDKRTRLDELKYGNVEVRAAFDLSYQRLDLSHARLFRLLSLNPGPDISTSAAVVLGSAGRAVILRRLKELVEAVTQDDSLRVFRRLNFLFEANRTTTRHALEALARAHLIERSTTYGRWRMHDLVRLFAGERSLKQANQDSRAVLFTLLLIYYLAGATAASAHLDQMIADPASLEFPDEEHALEWLDAEYSNLVAAAYAADDGSKLHAVVALGLPRALIYITKFRQRFDDLVALSPVAIRAARRLRDRHGEAVVLRNLGGVLVQVWQVEEAISVLQDAIQIYRDTDNQSGEGTALANLGGALVRAGRFEDAITTLHDALQIHRQAGARYSEAVALGNLGTALIQLGQSDEAIATLQAAAQIHREVHDQRGRAAALDNLGIALQEAGRYDEAIKTHQTAEKIHRLTDDRRGEATALINLGNAFRHALRFTEAIASVQDAAQIFDEIGDDHGQSTALASLEFIRTQRAKHQATPH